jgi:putative FmdB family regulatory protein
VPTYAYACTACNHRFEVVQSFADDSLTVCPECGGRLRKIFNAVGVVFKGNGFYRTDSRKELARAGSSAASKDSGKDSSKDSGKDSGKGSSKESDSSSGSTPSPSSTSRSPSTGAKGSSAPAATASTPAS